MSITWQKHNNNDNIIVDDDELIDEINFKQTFPDIPLFVIQPNRDLDCEKPKKFWRLIMEYFTIQAIIIFVVWMFVHNAHWQE